MVDAVLRRTNSVMEWLGYLSAAADAAGLGDVLKTETEDQTEEQRRRRILLQQMKQADRLRLGNAGYGEDVLMPQQAQ